jgi:hypothetical protein
MSGKKAMVVADASCNLDARGPAFEAEAFAVPEWRAAFVNDIPAIERGPR